MELTKDFWHKETQAKKRQFYFCPLAKKRPRVSAPAEPNGPVVRWTKEQIFLENIRRLTWRGDFET